MLEGKLTFLDLWEVGRNVSLLCELKHEYVYSTLWAT